MKTQSILVVGGYGIVGLELVEILTEEPHFEVFVGGRNIGKAQDAATRFNCQWKYIDVEERATIEEALTDIDIVVNCFISNDKVDVSVAELVAIGGKVYLDVAGIPLDHQYKIKKLHEDAKKSGALLTTGFGLNPGIAGIILKHHVDQFAEIDHSDIYFTMGANFDEISMLSLMGIGELMRIPPKVWSNERWVSPQKSSSKQLVKAPFNKSIFFGNGAITPDMLDIPNGKNVKYIAFWSGMENMRMSMLLYFGVKWGWTKNKRKASKLLNRLKKIGSKKKYHSDTLLSVVSSGTINGKRMKMETSFYCSEVHSTALAPALGCMLIAEGKIKSSGAFYATEIVDGNEFVLKLKGSNVHFSEEVVEL